MHGFILSVLSVYIYLRVNDLVVFLVPSGYLKTQEYVLSEYGILYVIIDYDDGSPSAT